MSEEPTPLNLHPERRGKIGPNGRPQDLVRQVFQPGDWVVGCFGQWEHRMGLVWHLDEVGDPVVQWENIEQLEAMYAEYVEYMPNPPPGYGTRYDEWGRVPAEVQRDVGRSASEEQHYSRLPTFRCQGAHECTEQC